LIKNKGKIQPFSSKSDRIRLQEVSNMVIRLGNFWSFGKLVAQERWQNNSRCVYLKEKSMTAIGKQYSCNQNSQSLHEI